jgi:hypothetical protein
MATVQLILPNMVTEPRLLSMPPRRSTFLLPLPASADAPTSLILCASWGRAPLPFLLRRCSVPLPLFVLPVDPAAGGAVPHALLLLRATA